MDLEYTILAGFGVAAQAALLSIEYLATTLPYTILGVVVAKTIEKVVKYGGCIYVCYTYLTYSSKRTITIVKKYEPLPYGKRHLVFLGDDGSNYVIGRNLLYLQWNKKKLWDKLEVGKKFFITTYGWKIPIVGILPQVISIKDSVL